MIGVVVITHGNLGQELINVAKMIKGDIECITYVSVDASKSVELIKKEITTAIKKTDRGKGILILTDLFGGTPSNISLSFLREDKIEVVTGVNLPMLLKICEKQEEVELTSFAEHVRDYGKNNIYIAGEVLRRKIDS
ncbi:MAG: PTS fructose transporter subunit IIA [Deltaproteobacteria bacterium]|nr:PTS fructose transporter subunit IIA [Deltaproteobacteria bacterium]